MNDFKPLNKQEIIKTWKYQCEDMSVLDGNEYHVPLSSILRAYETANYEDLTSIINNTFDVTQALQEAIEFLTKNSFQGYIKD